MWFRNVTVEDRRARNLSLNIAIFVILVEHSGIVSVTQRLGKR